MLLVVGVGIPSIFGRWWLIIQLSTSLKKLIQPGFLEQVLIRSYCVVRYIFFRELSVMLRI